MLVMIGLPVLVAAHSTRLAALSVLPPGTVAAWGMDLSGQASVPGGLSGIVDICAGNDYAIAVRDNGTIVSWGQSFWNSEPLIIHPSVTNVAAVAGLWALRKDGTVVGVGNGQVLGGGFVAVSVRSEPNLLLLEADRTVRNDFRPPPPGLDDVVEISAGAEHNPAAPIERVDCVIEDCVVEEPAINQAEMTTCIHMGAVEIHQGIDIGIHGYHRASVVRNCLIDCDYQINPVAISQIAYSGTTATVTTLLPHGRAVDDWVRIEGALVNGSLDNPYNGSFKITSATSTTFQYTMVATPAAVPAGDMWVDRFSSHYVPNTNLAKSGSGPYTVTVTTLTPHNRVPGNSVLMKNATPAAYNGSFRVSEVLGPKQFRYSIPSDPGTPTAWGFIGAPFQGISNDAGSEAVVEGNRIFNTRIGGPYHDTGSTKDAIVRNNCYRNVVTGPYQRLAGLSDAMPADAITSDGKTATFTIKSTKPHGLTVGQGVRIRNAKIAGSPAPPDTYNGEFAIRSMPTPTSFTYSMKEDPPANSDPGTGTVEALWQVQECRIENNVIDLIPSFMNWGAPTALALVAVPPVDMTPFRVFRRLQVRNNVIRNTDNLSEPVVRNLGIVLGYCEHALIEQNVIDLQIANPIRYSNSTLVRCFNNRDSTGKLIQGYSGSAVQDELTTFIEDAATICLV
jgi:hypothetical protein